MSMGKHPCIKPFSKVDTYLTFEWNRIKIFTQHFSKGFKTVIELLIEKGVNANAVDHWKLTPLHYIALVDSANEASKNWSQLESQAMEIVSELFERLMILDDDVCIDIFKAKAIVYKIMELFFSQIIVGK